MLKSTFISKLYYSNLTSWLLKASGLDKPIIGMTKEEANLQLKKSIRRLRYIQITADIIVGAVIGAILAFMLI